MADTPSSTLVRLQPGELSPGARDLLESFVPRGAHCLVVGVGNRAIRSWLRGRGCRPVEVAASQATSLPFEGESFDAALLIGVLGQLVSPDLAALELRPGGMLLVTATTLSYWRHRLDRAAGATSQLSGGVSPLYLRRLLLQGGFSLVGVEGQDGAFLRDLPWPDDCVSGGPRDRTGLPSASSRHCSGRRSERSPSGSEAPVLLVMD
jgi:hypothetical protein